MIREAEIRCIPIRILSNSIIQHFELTFDAERPPQPQFD